LNSVDEKERYMKESISVTILVALVLLGGFVLITAPVDSKLIAAKNASHWSSVRLAQTEAEKREGLSAFRIATVCIGVGLLLGSCRPGHTG
jgi:hypothetical protein